MTLRNRRWLAASLAAGLVVLLVGTASFDTLGNLDAPERFVLTEVSTYQPPLPPPPPPSRPSEARSGGSTGVELTLRASRAPVALDKMRLDVQFTATQVGSLSIAGLGEGIGVGTGDGTGGGSGTGFELVSLSELDQVPMVLSAPVFPYPEEAVDRGMAEFDLRYHILIDEEGRTYPIEIIESPFPALSTEFLEWASRVRFSPPTRLGIPVRTEYSWPVKIKR